MEGSLAGNSPHCLWPGAAEVQGQEQSCSTEGRWCGATSNVPVQSVCVLENMSGDATAPSLSKG